MPTVVTLSVALTVPATVDLREMVSTAQVRAYLVVFVYAKFMMRALLTHYMCVPARYSIGLTVT